MINYKKTEIRNMKEIKESGNQKMGMRAMNFSVRASLYTM